MHLRNKTASAAILLLFILLQSRSASGKLDKRQDLPEAEFHLARMKYATRGGGGSHGYFEPWWAIDYPVAEQHFLPALRRLTHLSVADDSIHLDATDKRLFDYPFAFLQQPGRGNWRPTDKEAEALRD